MWDRSEILRIEDRLHSARVPVAELCRCAGINRTTWVRWKNGSTLPTFRAWRSVHKALEQLLPAEAA